MSYINLFRGPLFIRTQCSTTLPGMLCQTGLMTTKPAKLISRHSSQQQDYVVGPKTVLYRSSLKVQSIDQLINQVEIKVP